MTYTKKQQHSPRQLMLSIVNTENDFEWYPTTNEIINAIKQDIKTDDLFDAPSVLDCGAGDGRVLKALKASKKYAIEKSQPLLESLDSDIFVVGTDFYEQTLIDKKVDIVFSNPPYSKFEQWSKKIITEANACIVYLVIPDRWVQSKEIQNAIESRDASSHIVASFNFENAQRQARAKVNIVKIELQEYSRFRGFKACVDPFELWFKQNFQIQANSESLSDYEMSANKKKSLDESLSSALVKRGDLVKVLEEHYLKEMSDLFSTYKKLECIDPCLLSEMNINLISVREALQLKIEGLKDYYWNQLIHNLDKVTNKLTSFSREKLLSTLTKHTHVDFSASNARAIVIWVIKNANQYFDDQLIKTVKSMTWQANIKLYKSNKRTFGDEQWRYCSKPEGLDRYKLEYRIILSHVGGLCNATYSFDKNKNGLSKHASTFLDDLSTVASNLGYDTSPYKSSKDFQWATHVKNTFLCRNLRTSEEMTLFEARAFKNGNLHLKLNQNFICRLNVEFGRLKGWIKSPKEATDELDISFEDAAQAFKSNQQLDSSNFLRLEVDRAA